MNCNAKTEYACLAMLELAQQFSQPKPIQLRSIAKKHGIPSQFLVQIMQQLKQAGLVVSTRGASGGYRLAIEPKKITLLDMFDLFECQSNGSPHTPSPFASLLGETFEEAETAKRRCLQATTLAELVQTASVITEAMYYI